MPQEEKWWRNMLGPKSRDFFSIFHKMVGGCLFCLCTSALLAYYSPKAKTHKKYLLPSRPPPSFKCWLKLLRFSTSNRPYCWQNGCSVELSVCTLLSSTLWTVGKLVVFAIVVYSSVWVGNRVYYFLLLFVCVLLLATTWCIGFYKKMQGRAQPIKGRWRLDDLQRT